MSNDGNTDLRIFNPLLVRGIVEEKDARIAALVAINAELLDALREIVAMTDEDPGTFRKRGRGLVGVLAAEAIAKATGA